MSEPSLPGERRPALPIPDIDRAGALTRSWLVSPGKVVDDRGSLARMLRLLQASAKELPILTPHEDPIPRQEIVKVPTRSVLDDANRANNLAARTREEALFRTNA